MHFLAMNQRFSSMTRGEFALCIVALGATVNLLSSFLRIRHDVVLSTTFPLCGMYILCKELFRMMHAIFSGFGGGYGESVAGNKRRSCRSRNRSGTIGRKYTFSVHES